MSTPGERAGAGLMRRAASAMPPVILLVLNVLVFGTYIVHSQNPGEFTLGYGEVMGSWLWPGVALFASLVAVAALLPRRASRVFLAALFSLGVLSYVHGNLLIWDTGVLDGNALDLSKAWRNAVDALLWVAVGAAAFRFRDWLAAHSWRICALLIAFQVIGILAGLPDEPQSDRSTGSEMPAGLAEFSRQGNVIHLVLDAFQASIFEQLLAEDERYGDLFSGFTFFRDATTPSAVTYLSVPASLSGRAFRNEQTITAYHAQTLAGYNVHSVLRDSGYAVDVATPSWWNAPSDRYDNYFRITAPYQRLEKRRLSHALLLADISLYRQAPHFLKARVYNSESWQFSRWLVEDPEARFEHFAHGAFFSDLAGQSRVGDRPPVYKFLHLISPHAPLVSGPDCSWAGKVLEYSEANFKTQSRCIVETLAAFLQRLRTLGVYDSSLIVVHGDHGGGVGFPMRSRNGGTVSSVESGQRVPGAVLPLVLVKPPGAEGRLRSSDAQVQLEDIPATIAASLAIGHRFPGRSMFDGNVGGERERVYYWSEVHRNDAAARNFFNSFNSLVVSGSVYEEASWREGVVAQASALNMRQPYEWNTEITFGADGNSGPYQDGGWIVTKTKEVTWTQGKEMGLVFDFPPLDGPVRFRATVKALLSPGRLDRQSVRIYAGQNLIDQWDVTEERFHERIIDIPAAALGAGGRVNFRFELPNAVSPAELGTGSDRRMLALAFMRLSFEPVKTD